MINSTKPVKLMLRIALLFGPFAIWIGCSTNSPKATNDAAAGSREAEAVNASTESTKAEESFEVRDPSHPNDGILVVLDSNAMRTRGLSKELVMRAMKPSELIESSRTDELPGVIYHNGLRDERFLDILLFASPDGKEVVKLKDVATLRLLDGREWTPRRQAPSDQ